MENDVDFIKLVEHFVVMEIIVGDWLHNKTDGSSNTKRIVGWDSQHSLGMDGVWNECETRWVAWMETIENAAKPINQNQFVRSVSQVFPLDFCCRRYLLCCKSTLLSFINYGPGHRVRQILSASIRQHLLAPCIPSACGVSPLP